MSNLTSTFDECRKQPDGETIDQLRANYFIDVAMNERDSTSAGGIIIPQAGIVNGVKERKERERSAKDIAFALKLLNDRLAQIEASLVDKYGEDFAENLTAEYLDEDTYKELMSIEDKEERRHAIANVIKEGIKIGTIDPATFNENSDFKEWLEVNNELEQQRVISKQINLENEVLSEQKIENTHEADQRIDLESGFDSLFTKNNSIVI